MTLGPLIFLCINAVALLIVPRRWAPLPFIMTACYLSIGQAIDLGGFTFTAIRLLVIVGLIRVLLRRERLAGGLNGLDWWLLAWSAWAILSGLLHEDPSSTFVNRLGLAYNTLGIYLLLRIFCSSIDDVIGLVKATAILLVPVSVEMVYEAMGFPSLFYAFEGTSRSVYIREERIRAVGPFAHPILAGTVGAVCLPLIHGIRQHRPRAARVGTLACVLMIVTSASSGPIMSAVAALAGLWMWRHRHRMRSVRWMAVGLYVALALAMKAPVYYLIARINFVDGSTGYHRALLIESSITYLSEWWIAGTDYTRHWAPSPGFSPQHTDITNQYLSMGIMGGLPLLLLFLGGMVKAFSIVGERMHEEQTGTPQANRFVVWGLGAALFAHGVTFLSVTYFDQSFVFLYLTLAAIGSARIASVAVAAPSAMPIRVEPGPGGWRRPLGQAGARVPRSSWRPPRKTSAPGRTA